MLVNLIPYLLGDEDRLLTVSNFFFSVSTAEQTRQHGSLRGGAPPQHHRQQPPRLQSPSRRSHPRVRQPLRRLFLRTRLQMGQRRRQAHGGRLRSPRNVPSLPLSFSPSGSSYWTAGFGPWISTRRATPPPSTRPTSRSIPTGATADGPSSPTRPPSSPSSRFPRFPPLSVGLPAGIVVRRVESAEQRAAAVFAVCGTSVVASVLRPLVYSGRYPSESARSERVNGIHSSEIE